MERPRRRGQERMGGTHSGREETRKQKKPRADMTERSRERYDVVGSVT